MTGTKTPAATTKTLFVSYTKADRAWAEWICAELQKAGYELIVQFLDMTAGTNFVVVMHDGIRACDKMIAVLSQAYEASAYASAEWTSVLAEDPIGIQQKLKPVRVEDYQPTGLLRPFVYVDLVDVPEENARQRLLNGVGGGRPPRSGPPPFPGKPSGP
jgi:hypothetical protein